MLQMISPADTFPAFQIFGNLYFVGSKPASVHVIDTGDGLIMLDTGYQHTLYYVIDRMYQLGLDVHDIKYILLTHGHIDHFGAARALRELTGAKIALGAEDRDHANGRLDLSYAKELGMKFAENFEPDILLQDGDTVALGNTTVLAVATPGHTSGAMSYFFDVTDGEETFRAGLHGGMGTNTMRRAFLDRYGLSYACREQFITSMERLKQERVDLFLGNHMQHNATEQKYAELQAGDRKAFIQPEEWAAYAEWAKQHLLDMLKEEEQ